MDNYLNQVLGERYEIQEIIGVGGMAVVYKAFDLVDKRTVAIKILKDEFLANDEFRRRFKNESKAIAVLAHPNIVKVYDVNFSDDLQYIVMEHVEGITLKEYIQRQKIVEWKEAVHFTVQILRALQHAHDKGIIHRDIKPQNIILLPNASIKVMDFGIARFNRGERISVIDSSAIGSVHYVSPEQARGDYTDEKSDIYSVGVVLYEMLTGKLPFESDSDESVALMQVREDAVRPSELNASIPVGLEQITMRAMQKNPADRYQSAAEFLLDLDEFKRNPQIKFDYSYFIDQTPTKFIDPTTPEPVVEEPAIEPPKPVAAPEPPAPPARVEKKKPKKEKRPPAPVVIDDDDDDDDDDYRPRNITIPILIAIAICLVLVVGVVFLAAFGDTIREQLTGENSSTSQSSLLEKIDIFGWFNKDKIEVPNFLNMKYDEVLSKYPDLIIDAPQYEYNSSYADGHVCNQSPEAGEKVSKDTVIKLTVATSGEMILIRDVAGLTAKEAEAILTGDGLTVMLVAQVDETKDEGIVLNTNPAANTYIARDDIVYVYYASGADGVDSLRVPDVVGYELEAARAKIEEVGLKVGSVTTSASSASMEGLVISQTPVGMTPVNAGTYVNLVVGSGKPAANTVKFTIPLPKVGSGSTGTLTTVLNGSTYDSIDGVSLNGSSYELSFTGTGSGNSFKIYIDSVLIYSGDIDFSVSPPTISNLTNYGYSVSETIPEVTGMSLAGATETLNAAGFFKLHTRYQNDDSVASGNVISQTPEAGSSSQYNSDTVITLIVSTGPNSGSSEPDSSAEDTEVIDYD